MRSYYKTLFTARGRYDAGLTRLYTCSRSRAVGPDRARSDTKRLGHGNACGRRRWLALCHQPLSLVSGG